MGKSLEKFKNQKNLLAFSAGVDSTALFFLLLDKSVNFDIAIVNYQTRKNSDDELNYAKELAKKYNKKCFYKYANLDDTNFEHKAREFRYSFFDKIIKEYNYQNLITAHQLNDKLEWFLMQFTKGAGCVELLGYEEFEKRENYNLIRPLIDTTKERLLNYLSNNNIKYFYDKSNENQKYKRNKFRIKYANDLLKEYEDGIKKSFKYIKKDKDRLYQLDIIKQIDKLYILKKSHDNIKNLRMIDKVLKKLGFVISYKTREEIIKEKSIVISHKISIELTQTQIFISPYITNQNMDKKFKDECRVLKIPPKTRGYLYKKNISPNTIV